MGLPGNRSPVLRGGGKSEHQQDPCFLTGRPCNGAASATENKPPRYVGVRVKWWGKSSPLLRWRWRQGKPHGVQVHAGCAPLVAIHPGRTLRSQWQRWGQINDYRSDYGRGTEFGLQGAPILLLIW